MCHMRNQSLIPHPTLSSLSPSPITRVFKALFAAANVVLIGCPLGSLPEPVLESAETQQTSSVRPCFCSCSALTGVLGFSSQNVLNRDTLIDGFNNWNQRAHTSKRLHFLKMPTICHFLKRVKGQHTNSAHFVSFQLWVLWLSERTPIQIEFPVNVLNYQTPCKPPCNECLSAYYFSFI